MSKTTVNTVYLLVGPRGSGKSTYGKKLVAGRQDLTMISRDEILVSQFGSTDISPYSGGHQFAKEEVSRLSRERLQSGESFVLDTWTGGGYERQSLIMELRGGGATRVIALYFITPVDFVREWFWKKPGVARLGEMGAKERMGFTFYLEETPERDHDLFHALAAEIDSDGFDEVFRVNPLQGLLF